MTRMRGSPEAPVRVGGALLSVVAIVAGVVGPASGFLMSARLHPPAIVWHRPPENPSPVQSASAHVLEIKETRSIDVSSATGVAIDRDRSAAAVVEQASSTRYNVHVQLSGGAEQVIAVTAPPGGLQLEVRDMAGDSTPNDLLIRPALHWPLIVLLNDGHNHFSVAISGISPDRLDSSSQAGTKQTIPVVGVLASSESKVGHPVNGTHFFTPEFQRDFLPTYAAIVFCGKGHEYTSGRAPPLRKDLI